jgi:hypothetical protein
MWHLVIRLAALLSMSTRAVDVIVRNQIPAKADSSCPACTTSAFTPDFTIKVWGANGQESIALDQEALFQVDMDFGGIGIQVNGFYFGFDKRTNTLAEDLSTDPNNVQELNPDNSGAQVYLNADCSFREVSTPWSGIGVPTYAIADLSSRMDGGLCKVTVKANDDTYRMSTFEGKVYHGFSSGMGGDESGSWVPLSSQNKVAAGCFLDADSYKASWRAISFEPNTFNIGSSHGNVEVPTYSCSSRSSATTTSSNTADSCSEDGSVWNKDAAGHTCGSRIVWVQDNIVAGDLRAAKDRVALEYPSACGACASLSASPMTTSTASSECGEGGSVWNTHAAGRTCGSRILWVQVNLLGGDLSAAKARVALEYPGDCGACAAMATATTSQTTTDECNEGSAIWNMIAEGHTCGSRINWVRVNIAAGNMHAAKTQVASEFPHICGACASSGVPAHTPSALRGSVR